MPQQINQQRNGRRTDPLDDAKRRNMQVFMLRAEQSSQQRERTASGLDEGGFGDCADLWVVGGKTTCPVKYQVWVFGKNRFRLRKRCLRDCDSLAEANRDDDCESMF